MSTRPQILRWLYYTLNSGKNSKLAYYVSSYIAINMPRPLLAWRYQRAMETLRHRSDKDYITARVDYYNQLTADAYADREAFRNASVALRNQPMTGQKVYYLDAYRYARYFPQSLRWVLLPGDIVHVPDVPSITKSRPLVDDNTNSVLMKLDKVRHFLFVNDRKRFADKKDMAIFRGLIGQDGGHTLKKNRYDFVRRFFGHSLFNIGVTDERFPQWQTDKLTIKEHLDYKFIMALEGNDVASNLKWVMSSNSVAVMPRPTCETWFMEGRLVPDYHYIEVKPDFSDLEERLNHYIQHPEEAEAIIRHAHEYVDQFRDKKRERLISLLVLKKYFELTNRE